MYKSNLNIFSEPLGVHRPSKNLRSGLEAFRNATMLRNNDRFNDDRFWGTIVSWFTSAASWVTSAASDAGISFLKNIS